MFFLVGSTGVGKSEIAVGVAERCGAEIVGADAFQVYAGLDILTARPSRDLLERAPHHLIGTIPLTENFDVEKYRKAALETIREIVARGKRALVVGGTGLYVRALTRGLAELPAADAALRAELEALSLEELQLRYAKLDPAGATKIDSRNPRRLVRAIEVCVLTGQPFSSFQKEWKTDESSVKGVLLLRERDDLYSRIDRRVIEMFRSGLLDEVRATGEVSMTASQAIGLREARACLNGEITEAEAIARIQQATRRYAKRQLTWFRREASLQPFHLSTVSHLDSIISPIARLLKDASAIADD